MAVGDRRKQDRRLGAAQVSENRRRDDRRNSRERRHGERRAAARVNLELWMEEVSGDDVYFRRSGNVGEGGVFFDRAIPHALGTMVTLKFALPGDREMVVARGEVVSGAGSRNGLGMGVRFLNIEGDGLDRVRDFIRHLA